MGRDGPYDRSAFAHGLPHEPRPQPARVFPPSPPLPAHPPPALSPAPNPPGGRPARWAERRRRPRGPARLRRSDCISCRRGCACPAPLAPPACRRARSFRGRHALECAGTAPSCHRPAGPPGLSSCRPAPCSCATPMRQSWCADRDLRVGENEHLLTWPHQLACARQRVGQTALSSPVLLVARVAPRCSAWFGLVITRPHSSLTAASGGRTPRLCPPACFHVWCARTCPMYCSAPRFGGIG